MPKEFWGPDTWRGRQQVEKILKERKEAEERATKEQDGDMDVDVTESEKTEKEKRARKEIGDGGDDIDTDGVEKVEKRKSKEMEGVNKLDDDMLDRKKRFEGAGHRHSKCDANRKKEKGEAGRMDVDEVTKSEASESKRESKTEPPLKKSGKAKGVERVTKFKKTFVEAEQEPMSNKVTGNGELGMGVDGAEKSGECVLETKLKPKSKKDTHNEEHCIDMDEFVKAKDNAQKTAKSDPTIKQEPGNEDDESSKPFWGPDTERGREQVEQLLKQRKQDHWNHVQKQKKFREEMARKDEQKRIASKAKTYGADKSKAEPRSAEQKKPEANAINKTTKHKEQETSTEVKQQEKDVRDEHRYKNEDESPEFAKMRRPRCPSEEGRLSPYEDLYTEEADNDRGTGCSGVETGDEEDTTTSN